VALNDTLKEYLDITWDDSHTDAKLDGILERAQAKICAYAGSDSVDFGDGTEEQQLLLDLCRYIYNNASEDFETNYKADLLMLRAKYATADPEQEVNDDETDEISEVENSG
jgi:hypothetical protein